MIDGFFLKFLLAELRPKIIDSYIHKIYQPSKYEIVLYLRKDIEYKLLINISATGGRICFIDKKIENPLTPKMFCLLARKYLHNTRLIEMSQYQLDRLIFLTFEGSNEIGEKMIVKLAVELMGKHSNLILLDDKDVIIDALKRVDINMSRDRQILPQLGYKYPPGSDKINIIREGIEEILIKVKEKIRIDGDLKLSEILVKVVCGMSPVMARELAYLASGDENLRLRDVDDKILVKLKYRLEDLKNILENDEGKPYLFLDGDGKVKEMYFVELGHLDGEIEVVESDSFSHLLARFFDQKDEVDRITQNAGDMLVVLNRILKKLRHKLEIQKNEKLECEDREKIQQRAILLQSNLYRLAKREDNVVLKDFFNDNQEIRIDLDKSISPASNAQKLFNKYKKMCVADKKLAELIIQTQNEISYIESVIDFIMRSDSYENLMQIKKELQDGGYLKKKVTKDKKNRNISPLNSIFKTKSDDGFEILVGNNNVNNDWLTLRYASKNDIWLHTQKIPGAHVIIVSNGNKIPLSTIKFAAGLAMKNSKAKDSNLVPVDFTYVKHVKKYKGAKPGMVIYDNFKTIIVKN